MNRSNPYVIGGESPKLKKSVVAFIDILGYKQLVKKAYKNGNAESLLRRLHCALQESREHVDPSHADDFCDIRGKDFSAVSSFTDNIVLGYPTLFFGAEELDQAFRKLSRFQMRLAIAGFFVRGGISVGDLYMDETVVYGYSLLEAYGAEGNDAIVPRIILAKSAEKAVKKELGYYPLKDNETPHIQYISKDVDGKYYLDYLQTVITAEEYFSKKRDLKTHKEKIERQLKTSKTNKRIWDKYVWIAKYHNSFCEQCGDCKHLTIDIGDVKFPVRNSIIDKV